MNDINTFKSYNLSQAQYFTVKIDDNENSQYLIHKFQQEHNVLYIEKLITERDKGLVELHNLNEAKLTVDVYDKSGLGVNFTLTYKVKNPELININLAWDDSGSRVITMGYTFEIMGPPSITGGE